MSIEEIRSRFPPGPGFGITDDEYLYSFESGFIGGAPADPKAWFAKVAERLWSKA